MNVCEAGFTLEWSNGSIFWSGDLCKSGVYKNEFIYKKLIEALVRTVKCGQLQLNLKKKLTRCDIPTEIDFSRLSISLVHLQSNVMVLV